MPRQTPVVATMRLKATGGRSIPPGGRVTCDKGRATPRQDPAASTCRARGPKFQPAVTTASGRVRSTAVFGTAGGAAVAGSTAISARIALDSATAVVKLAA